MRNKRYFKLKILGDDKELLSSFVSSNDLDKAIEVSIDLAELKSGEKIKGIYLENISFDEYITNYEGLSYGE